VQHTHPCLSPIPYGTDIFSLSVAEGVVAYSIIPERTMKAIVYPKSLKDIPPWRRRQITQDIRWFSRYSPTERLEYVDREWADIQNFIKEYGLQKHGTRKRNKPTRRHSLV
jgi:hypothetical protein